jgi:hypothetical protein
LPEGLVQERLKVLVVVAVVVSGPITCEPDIATEPDQSPDAVHAVAFADTHERVTLDPDTTVPTLVTRLDIVAGGSDEPVVHPEIVL